MRSHRAEQAGTNARAPRVAPRPPLPRPGERWALLLDVDGTLVEFTDHPADVVAGPRVVDLLLRLHARCDGALAVISGRSIVDLDRLLGSHAFPVAGQHGLERRDAAGRVRRHDELVHRLRPVLKRLRRFAATHAGVLVEDKGASVAVHYRRAPEHEGAVAALMARMAAQLGPRFEVLPGAMVSELRPAGRDKGTAVAAFLREPPFRGRTPVFVGDDRSDEYGFRAVRRRGGRAIKVGDGPSAATHRLHDAEEVRRWLGRVAAALA